MRTYFCLWGGRWEDDWLVGVIGGWRGNEGDGGGKIGA